MEDVMNQQREPLQIGSRRYQHTFAENLVQSMGMGDAISFCAQNGWSDTLNMILKSAPPERKRR